MFRLLGGKIEVLKQLLLIENMLDLSLHIIILVAQV